MNFKYLEKELGGKKLELFKAADFCGAEKPRLTAVFIHGIAADSSNFTEAMEFLESAEAMREVRFVTFDLLGAGKSLTSDALKYNFEEQLEALSNSIRELDIKTPVVLVGHSMGTLIVTRFAEENPEMVRELVLVSPPIYHPKDFENPKFVEAMENVGKMMEANIPEAGKREVFKKETENIVLNPKNYQCFCEISCPTTIIYGEKDKIIASYNIPGVLRKNQNIKVVKTEDGHNMTTIKTEKVLAELERILGETL